MLVKVAIDAANRMIVQTVSSVAGENEIVDEIVGANNEPPVKILPHGLTVLVCGRRARLVPAEDLAAARR